MTAGLGSVAVGVGLLRRGIFLSRTFVQTVGQPGDGRCVVRSFRPALYDPLEELSGGVPILLFVDHFAHLVLGAGGQCRVGILCLQSAEGCLCFRLLAQVSPRHREVGQGLGRLGLRRLGVEDLLGRLGGFVVLLDRQPGIARQRQGGEDTLAGRLLSQQRLQGLQHALMVVEAFPRPGQLQPRTVLSRLELGLQQDLLKLLRRVAILLAGQFAAVASMPSISATR